MSRMGRPTNPQRGIKRTFYLPMELANYFSATMGDNTSRAVAGGMVFMLGATRTIQQDVMDIARRLPPEQAAREIRRRLPQWLAEIVETQRLARLPAKERARLLTRRKEHAVKE